MPRPRLAAAALLALLAAAAAQTPPAPAPFVCDWDRCLGPCHCPSPNAPKGLLKSQTPQFVLITHDDAVTPLSDSLMRQLTDGFENANGCNVPATWFVSNQGTECPLVKQLHADNHEIAVHTLNHASLDPAFAEKKEQIEGGRAALVACGVPAADVVGFRSPYLVHNPAVRETLFKADFLYDSSIVEVAHPTSASSPDFGRRVWPYT